ncbi:Asp23/Gls24 family envelope stress response protein [Corynebacterium suedekumii]|uniref:Asp23/Gls24 family envelope stress response protein n=1 Tax=Corynebacterium suedekumii TaxID=3049801 RepID=A0ABY8VNT9_9CORY|nr:Asp23/Gls24 family envelope stress response protein [Corynebacterium suedekumii]WIM71304.1 Asp23/Gls24 family envelope stress response protein [Corynebacterium suedekumii]WIM73078.1 Asp23/Gls24 family envelope stress response protein [Corynebacterium suedekumii]
MSDQHQDISTPEADHPSEQRTATTTTTSRGVTRIEDVVVGKIAGLAAREVSGVHALGGGASRMVGAIRESFAGSASNVMQGVTVEVGERQAAVDVSIVAEYGVAIHELAEAIRRNIITAIERMTGLEVTEVNVTVHDVHLDFGGDDEDTAPAAPLEHTPRVQ